jgi:hypothetical protein
MVFFRVVVAMMVSINTSGSATPIIMAVMMHEAEEEEALPTVEEAKPQPKDETSSYTKQHILSYIGCPPGWLSG